MTTKFVCYKHWFLQGVKNRIVSNNFFCICSVLYILGFITESDSCFTYRAKLTHEYYSQPLFIPVFDISSSNQYADCGDNFQCRYDMALTSDQAVATDTMQIQKYVQELDDMSQPGNKLLCCEIKYTVNFFQFI